MKVILVGARGGMCHLLHSRRPRRAPENEGAWRVARAASAGVLAALTLSACTLTSESFDPALVDRTQAASTPTESGPSAAPASPSAADGSSAGPASLDPDVETGTDTATDTGGGEDGSEPVRLEPSEPNEGQLGTSSDPQGQAAPNADAGATPSDPGPEPSPEPDAGGPVTIASTCSTQSFGDSCYEVFGEPLAWVDAEARCVAWGGHLASVESVPEDTFLEFWPQVLGLTPANGSGIWIGGTDAALDGVFLWANGSPVLVNGWAPGQPNDGAGVDCIEKRNDGTDLWYDQRCTDGRPFLCERPL